MLKFTVDGQKLELLGDPFVVADSFDFLTGSFKFYSGRDWDLTEKHVFFQLGEATPYEVILVDDQFIKTDHVNLTNGVWNIYVIGYDIDGATLVERITTNKVSLTAQISGVQDGEPFPPSIIPDVLIVKDQTTPQTFINGVPRLAADRVIENENDMVDAKHVADAVAAVTADNFAHNSLGSLQGGSATERYHMTQAENTALHAHSNKTALDAVAGVNTGDQSASSFNHNDLANKQGGTTNEFYHVTAAEKTVIEHTSGTNTGDQVLPTRDSLGLDTDDTVTFANLSGTNTGDQDVSGAISTHNTDAGAHATLLGAKVDKTGTGQVTPINISGVTAPENLFSTATLERTGKYVTIDAGHINYGTNAYLNSYIIPIADASYLFTFVRFGLLLAADRYTAIGGLLENVTEISGVGTGAAYIAFSFTVSTYPPASYSVAKRTYTMPNWIGIPELQASSVASAGLRKPKSISVSGNIASGGNLYLATAMNNLRKNEKIVFTGDITSFNSMEIGLTYSSSISTGKINRVVIGTANISVYTDGTTATTEAHGLTTASNLQVILDQTAVGTILITIISGGNSFSKEYTWTRKAIGTPYALSSGTVMVDCKLSWTCSDLNKSIWLFGDSYFGYSSARWTYYLHSLGYDENVLLDGFAGEGGVNGINAIKYLIQYGAPRYIVWCLGMSDGTDSATPNADWVTYRDQMLALCVTHGITPVFGTIPTVPAINHEQKNAWIRASGYRYIDFAKAVGANSSGVWYAGMLGADKVHPTALGAKALNARALADIPEMMVIT